MANWYPGISIVKDPDSILDYQWDFTSWLASGDTVASYVVTADPGITVESDSNDTTSVTVWLSGGTAGQAYTVSVRATTQQGRTVERSVIFIISEQ